MNFSTRFNPPKSKAINQDGEKSRTKQSEADSCDINKIMERFNRTGKLPMMQTLPANYGDARVVDFQTAQSIVIAAKSQFASLPSKTRKAFGNDPQSFLDAIADKSEDNLKQLEKLGILVPKKETPEDVLKQIAINTQKSQEKPADQK